MAAQEWAGIKRAMAAEHGDLVGAQEDRLLAPTDYSPSIDARA
jgi:hypothetical protein